MSEKSGATPWKYGCLRGAGDEELEVLVVGREQHQRAEAGRADGIALGHRLGGVADGVERVGRLAHFLRQAGHFGDAAGIVGDRTEGVERDDDAGQRQHRGHRDGDAEQAGEVVADQDAGDDDQRRHRRSTSIEIARPWITLVPWPVTEACAIDCTGRIIRCRCSIR